MKKIVSIILAVLLLVSAFALPSSAVTGKGNEYPIILVIGRGAYTPYYSPSKKQIFPIRPDSDYILDAVKDCLPDLAKGLVTGKLDPWAEKVADYVAPLYEELIPDKDGNVTGGPTTLNGYGRPLTAGTSVYDYSFNYDWRKDPTESADYLNEYIQQIKEATGSEKVCLIPRCYGANVVAAYLYEYGHEDVDTVVFYCSTALGAYASGCLFAGDIAVDSAVLEGFVEGDFLTDYIDDPVILEFLRATISFLNTFYGLELTTKFLNSFVEKVFPALAPKVFPVCYGTMACFWDMVDNGRYEKAKKLIYNGQEEEYAGFIEKIDHYHYDIAANLPGMLTAMADEGLNVAVVAKYGRQALYPLYDNGNPQSDDTVEIPLSTFGSTSSKLGEVLSDEYLKSADMKYVSPDHCIDASTAAFKDSTWYIKGIDHSTFPASIDELMRTICNYDGQMTVSDNEEYPQYLKYDYSTTALSALDDQPEVKEVKPLANFFDAFKRFIKAGFELIKMLLAKIEK